MRGNNNFLAQKVEIESISLQGFKKYFRNICKENEINSLEDGFNKLILPLLAQGLKTEKLQFAITHIFDRCNFLEEDLANKIDKIANLAILINSTYEYEEYASDITDKIFDILAEEYTISRTIFLEKFIAEILNQRDLLQDNNQQFICLYQTLLSNFHNCNKTIIFLDDGNPTIYPLVRCLDMNNPEMAKIIYQFLDSYKSLSSNEYVKLYSNLLAITLTKSNSEIEFADKLIKALSKRIYYNAEIDANLKVNAQNNIMQYWHKSFSEKGYNVSETASEDEFKQFYDGWIRTAKTLLEKQSDIVESLFCYLASMCTMHNYEHKVMITEFILYNYDLFSPEKLKYILSEKDSFIDLETIASIISRKSLDEEIAHIIEQLLDTETYYQETEQNSLFKDIAAFNSAHLAEKLFEFILKTEKLLQIIEANKSLITKEASNYYLLHSLFFHKFRMNGSSSIDYNNYLEQLNSTSFTAESLNIMYTEFIREKYSNKSNIINHTSLPKQDEINIAFIEFLAQKDDLMNFLQLLNLYVEHESFPLYQEQLNKKLPEIAPTYNNLLNHFKENYKEYRQDCRDYLSNFFSQSEENSNLGQTINKMNLLFDQIFVEAKKIPNISPSDKSDNSSEITETSEELNNNNINSAPSKPPSKSAYKKQQKKRNSLIAIMISKIAAISEYQNEEDLFSLVSDNRKSDKVTNLGLLLDFFSSKLQKEENLDRKRQYLNILKILINTAQEISSLKESEILNEARKQAIIYCKNAAQQLSLNEELIKTAKQNIFPELKNKHALFIEKRQQALEEKAKKYHQQKIRPEITGTYIDRLESTIKQLKEKLSKTEQSNRKINLNISELGQELLSKTIKNNLLDEENQQSKREITELRKLSQSEKEKSSSKLQQERLAKQEIQKEVETLKAEIASLRKLRQSENKQHQEELKQAINQKQTENSKQAALYYDDRAQEQIGNLLKFSMERGIISPISAAQMKAVFDIQNQQNFSANLRSQNITYSFDPISQTQYCSSYQQLEYENQQTQNWQEQQLTSNPQTDYSYSK